MSTINKLPKNAGIIFSVFQETDSHINAINHDGVLKSLIYHEIPFKVVEGCYTYENGGKSHELGFYVETNDNINMKYLEDFVKSQCLNFNQESYLKISHDRDAQLIYLDNRSHSLGKFRAVPKLHALNSTAYTYCPQLETYYICEGGQ